MEIVMFVSQNNKFTYWLISYQVLLIEKRYETLKLRLQKCTAFYQKFPLAFCFAVQYINVLCHQT